MLASLNTSHSSLTFIHLVHLIYRSVHHNYNGILAYASSDQNDAMIEDVTAKNNFNFGMGFRGPGMKVKDSVSSYNGQSGIKMAGEDRNNPVTVVQFQGIVSCHHNKVHGILVDVGVGRGPTNQFAEVNVAGVLNSYLNKEHGIFINTDVNMKNQNFVNGFTVDESGSFNACNNGRRDITNKGKVKFVDMGMGGYTCNVTATLGAGEGLPVCEDCPACDN